MNKKKEYSNSTKAYYISIPIIFCYMHRVFVERY